MEIDNNAVSRRAAISGLVVISTPARYKHIFRGRVVIFSIIMPHYRLLFPKYGIDAIAMHRHLSNAGRLPGNKKEWGEREDNSKRSCFVLYGTQHMHSGHFFYKDDFAPPMSQ